MEAALITNGNGSTPHVDASVLAALEEHLAHLVYRLENRITEQLDERLVNASTEIVGELNRQFGSALEVHEDSVTDRLDKIESRISLLEERLNDIRDAINDAISEAGDGERYE